MDSKRKFRFKLAGHLNMTVRELEQRMTIKEFHEWYEYAKDEPLIADRLEMMLAQVISTTSGKPSYEHMVSISDEDKKKVKQDRVGQDLKNSLRW